MTYDEEKTVTTTKPNGDRREVTRTETNYVPTEPHYVPVVREQHGISGTSVALIVIASVSVLALLFVLLLNNQRAEDENANRPVVVQQEPQQPIIVQQPASQQQPPVVVQQPASQPPVIVGGSSNSTSSVEKDMNIQTEIEKRLNENAIFSGYDITATVIDGEVTLLGTVDSEEIKRKIEKMVKEIKDVKKVNNRLIVITR